MQDQLRLQINGEDVTVRGPDAFLTLSTFLRIRRRLTGTKIVCSEGDCGSCTVLCGFRTIEGVVFRPIDSCIRFMFQLDGTQIVTVEGLKHDGRLTAIQQAMIDCHGSQCGFCTPGFVVAMAGLLKSQSDLSEQHLRRQLTGNLCRCTGYTPIIQAGLAASGTAHCHHDGETNRASSIHESETAIDISAQFDGMTHRVFCPITVAQAVEFLSTHPEAQIVSGATDLGVQFNKGTLQTHLWMDLNRLRQLEGVSIRDNCLIVGARATWSDLEATIEEALPQFHSIVSVFGSPQIRHVGTVVGNIVNASPIADSVPLLLVCDAELTIASSAGDRKVKLNDFYRGYKDIDLGAGELATQVTIPLPPPERLLRLYKVSRRRDLDIASFTAAIWIELEGNTIRDAGIAYGAVGPVVTRLRDTEAFLRGQPFSSDTMTQAGEIAVTEISPISDVRGRASYRLQLARNVLKKFYWELAEEKQRCA